MLVQLNTKKKNNLKIFSLTITQSRIFHHSVKQVTFKQRLGSFKEKKRR